jgi:hypothetical protein
LKVLAAWLAAAAIIGALSFKAVLGAKELLAADGRFFLCAIWFAFYSGVRSKSGF